MTDLTECHLTALSNLKQSVEVRSTTARQLKT